MSSYVRTFKINVSSYTYCYQIILFKCTSVLPNFYFWHFSVCFNRLIYSLCTVDTILIDIFKNKKVWFLSSIMKSLEEVNLGLMRAQWFFKFWCLLLNVSRSLILNRSSFIFCIQYHQRHLALFFICLLYWSKFGSSFEL